MLIKIYTEISNCTPSSEQLHIIENVKDVVIHQGNWDTPSWLNSPVASPHVPWGPEPRHLLIEPFHADSKDTVRVIDYTADGERKRALVKSLAYVCNDNGKTIERVIANSGAKLSIL